MLTLTTALLVAVVVPIVGLLILWSNPSRRVNRAVFAGTLQMAAWLGCWHMAATSRDGLFWLKWTCAVGALGPLNFWVVKETLRDLGDSFGWTWFKRNLVWLMVPGCLAILPFTEFFIPSYSTREHPVYGWGYYAYMWGHIALYVVLFKGVFGTRRALVGAQRLELQVWLGGGCVLAMTIYLLMGLSALTKDPSFRRLQPLAVLLFYVGTAYAVTTHRIFDARQILLVCLEKLALIGIVVGSVFALQAILAPLLPAFWALLFTVISGLWIAAVVNGQLDRFFKFYPQATAARQAMLMAARRESRADGMAEAFLQILRGWGQTDEAAIFWGNKEGMRKLRSEAHVERQIVDAMQQLRWATPERLKREKPTPPRDALAKFLREQRLGALVIGDGSAMTALVGVGGAASRRPFTFPQVTQLLELTSIVESALERAHLSLKAQHAEQLATVGMLGASLAHEIRNPLVSIKTFVQLLPQHHQDPAFREKFFRLIGSEVERIDLLTEQLLDLASPRAYTSQSVELHPILRSSLELVTTKAAHKSVQIFTDFRADSDRVFTDGSAAKQVVLNLCFNAIQAVESQESNSRWVRVSTRNIADGVEMAVSDSGPGISDAIRPRLFEPFQTTKSSGFGLGLAICSDILANLNAKIAVDPPIAGCGATFRVTFPCRALSS